ncbi:unnamed protein product [Durusdinium trenchii]|uniref:C3H1-type domain-containing protein n=1 Tax=Durusdinium trenchii TaxID=1381693 RepID=A0ABP0RU61_9DINO
MPEPGAVSLLAAKRLRLTCLMKTDDQVKWEALKKFKAIVLDDPDGSKLGRCLVSAVRFLQSEQQWECSFNDAFEGKSTATLVKRSASLWRFKSWCEDNRMGAIISSSESTVYRYMQFLKEHGAPTTATSFLQAWTFLHHQIGLLGYPLEDILSSRVRGAARAMMSEKRVLQQAAPLSVKMIVALENVANFAPYPHRRIIAGHFLLCMGSSRFGDSIHLHKLEVTFHESLELVEAESKSFKTGLTEERKKSLLPLLSLGRFLGGQAWASKWIEERQKAQLGLDPSLPAYSEISNTWLDRRDLIGRYNAQVASGERDLLLDSANPAGSLALIQWKLAERTQGALTQRPDGTKPTQVVFNECMNHPEVQFCLIPRVKVAKADPPSLSSVQPNARNKPKGKGLGKVRNEFNKDPKQQALPEGCNQTTPQNKPICNTFNRGKCTFAKEGKRCKFGFHGDEPGGKRPRLETNEIPLSRRLPIFPDAQHSSRAIFCEVFAGCGRLSRFAQLAGFATLAIDGPRNQHLPESPILNLDLVEKPMQDCLLRVVSDIKPAFIHVAIPCGTGSRAREKPIPRHLKQAGAPEPRQLRDKNFLLGFPDLSPNERARVEAANELARFTIQLFSVAVAQGTIVCIENPLNSWMWGVLTHFANTLLPQNQAIVWHAMRNIEGDIFGEEDKLNGVADDESMQSGVYHTPSQFVSLAQMARHPCDHLFSVEDNTRDNLFDFLTKGPNYIAKQRIEFARRVAIMAKELQPEEDRFFSTLPMHAQSVLRGKRLLLFRELLKQCGCPDLEPANLILGTDLVGTPSKSPLFDTKIKPATWTPEYALLTSTWQRKKMEAKNIHGDDPELSVLLWDTTLKEVELGFLEGPFNDLEQVRKVVGQQLFVCSRRFVIVQSGKPRVIDDFKESGVNRTYTAIDKLALHDIDYIASLAHLISTTLSRAKANGGRVVIPRNDGRTLEGSLHPSFEGSIGWQGRCVDLSKAYKQVPVSSESRCFAVLMVHHPQTGEPTYFVSRSLPFGASASVYAFNRISRSLHHLSTVGCRILGGVFYDDFPLLEPESTCTLASHSFEGMVRSLGWSFTADPSKVVPFAPCFDVLGVRLSLGDLGEHGFNLGNKPSRIEKITGLLEEVIKKGSINVRQSQVIHGNLNFAMGFFLGHSLKIAARAFAFLSTGNSRCRKDDLVAVCKWTIDVMATVQPKHILPGDETRSVVVFTDAAYENDVATWGIVVLDAASGLRTSVGGIVPKQSVDAWHTFGVEQVITLAEAFAVLLARHMFRSFLLRRKVLFFVDNEGARFSLIKASSASLPLLLIVQLFHSCPEYDLCVPWIERVPSPSNIADLPSRDKNDDALRMIDGTPWSDLSSVDEVSKLCADFSGMPALLKFVEPTFDDSHL